MVWIPNAVYYGQVTPHNGRRRRVIEWFNMTMLIILVHHYLAFGITSHDIEVRFMAGSSAMGVLGFTILINLIYIIWDVYSTVKNWNKDRKRKAKLKARAEKKLQESKPNEQQMELP